MLEGSVSADCATEACAIDGWAVDGCVLDVAVVSTPVDVEVGPGPGELGPPPYIHSGGSLLSSSFAFSFSISLDWRRFRRRR